MYYLRQVSEEINPQLLSCLQLPSSLYATPLSSRDLIMADSLAMRTEPLCVWDGLKTGTSPVFKRKGVSEGMNEGG